MLKAKYNLFYYVLSSELGNMTQWSKKNFRPAGIISRISHNVMVAVPLKKPVDAGYPKYPESVSADVPAETPLLKVNDYGPFGARFFCATFCRGWTRAEALNTRPGQSAAEHWLGKQELWAATLEGMGCPIG